jgi:ribosomal protein S18 acetylase RimI-like enzyme
VKVQSLGYRTDLMIRELEGCLITDRGDHLVIRSPHNPDFWWGNCLLVPPLAPGDLANWVDRFAAEFPDARHVAIGVDATDAAAPYEAELAAAGLDMERSVVLTAGEDGLCPPSRPNAEATYRALSGDDDWEQAIRLRAAISEGGPGGGDSEFNRARVATERALTEAGHATWHGAFLGDALVAQMGVVADAASGLARYQNVETHPGFRQRGLAGTLTWHAGRAALASLGARGTLVIVADPDYVAISVYRSVGFTDTESHIGLQRPQADSGGAPIQ